MNEAFSTSIARQISVRAVFEAMLKCGPISRAELARITGLSKQTTSDVVRALEEARWIRLRGQTQGAIGRSATMYEVEENNAFALGADLGGTKIHVAIANLLGVIVGELTEPTDRQGGHAVVAQIHKMMSRIAARAGLDPALIRCGAIGSPGVFQPESGHINFAPNIPGLDEIDVAKALNNALGFPVAIENDVNLAALGERRQGFRLDAPNFAFIALGTGIGMGMVANGQLVRGARGGAGEIAYLPIGGDPFDSRSFKLGTLESAIGSAAITERYAALGGDPTFDVRVIFDRLGTGDRAAATTLDEIARLMFQAIMAIRALLDPELVVLGGSIGCRSELVTRVRDLAARFMADPLPIEASALGSRATLVGAIGLGVDTLQATLFGAVGTAADSSVASVV